MTVVKNAFIIDGTGRNGYNGHIFINDGGIIECISVGDIGGDICGEIIDCDGMTVTPGFIDMHRHCDLALFKHKQGFGAIELAQGITYAATGACGLTPFPFKEEYGGAVSSLIRPCLGEGDMFADFIEYKQAVDKLRAEGALPIEIGCFIGSCAVRIAVKGMSKSHYTMHEMGLAKRYIRDAMDNSALGMSLGIMYPPEFYSDRRELTELAKTIAPYDGLLTAHIRGEGDNLVQSVAEVLEIAEHANVRLQISHFKACGVKNWGKSIHAAIQSIEQAQSRGVDVTVDFYPYCGGATTLLSLVPPIYLRDSLDETWAYMEKESGIYELQSALAQEYDDWDNYVLSLGWDRIIITGVDSIESSKYLGKSIGAIASEYGFASECHVMCSLLAKEQGNVGITVMSMSDEDIDTIARLPYSMVISDALYNNGVGGSHPRMYGSFPKIIRDFVIGRGILTLPEAVCKMSGMPAQRLKLPDRGFIRKGYIADLNIFDPLKISDLCDFTHMVPSGGIYKTLLRGR